MTIAKTIAKTIALAKQYASNGNTNAAKRILNGSIRAATSDSAASAYRAALKEIEVA